jgi:iron uptake system component EfeO
MPSRSVRRIRSVGLSTVGVSGLVAITALTGCGSSSTGTKPAASGSTSTDSRTVSVEITNDGCKPAKSDYTSGPLTFSIKNKDATGVTELELLNGDRIIGEKENLAPGFAGSFALNLSAGDYTIYCPGATTAKSTIKVTGGAVSQAPTDTAALLAAGTKDYAQYVNTQVALMVTNTQPLIDAIKAGNLTAAQTAYAKARPYYERIEPVAESFTSGKQDLDADIDARADDVPVTKLTGYHRLEYGLFQVKSTTGLEPIATQLLANIVKLQGLTKDLTYQPAELANGAVGLLDEAAKSKITGEEERYSHIDLVDLGGNVEGSEQAFAALKPGLDKIDPTLATQIQDRFTAIDTLLNKYRDAANGGFVLYTKLTPADTKAIAQAIQAVSEPLSKVAGKVVNS